LTQKLSRLGAYTMIDLQKRLLCAPITKIHWKNMNEILDMSPKLGHLRVLTSIKVRFESSSLFPNACSKSELHGTQRSNTDAYCTAPVPFGSAPQTVGEGREKERLTLQRIASPIVHFFCSLFVATTYVLTFVSHANSWRLGILLT